MSASASLPEGYVLGVDFGLKNIGIAVGQTVTGHGNGLTTLKAKNGNPVDWLELKALIDDYQPIAIVVGLPLNMDGSDSDMAQRARKFADTMAHRCKRSVVMCDERLSSWSAHRAAGNTNTADVHQESACRIVETWLREQNLST